MSTQTLSGEQEEGDSEGAEERKEGRKEGGHTEGTMRTMKRRGKKKTQTPIKGGSEKNPQPPRTAGRRTPPRSSAATVAMATRAGRGSRQVFFISFVFFKGMCSGYHGDRSHDLNVTEMLSQRQAETQGRPAVAGEPSR